MSRFFNLCNNSVASMLFLFAVLFWASLPNSVEAPAPPYSQSARGRRPPSNANANAIPWGAYAQQAQQYMGQLQQQLTEKFNAAMAPPPTRNGMGGNRAGTKRKAGGTVQGNPTNRRGVTQHKRIPVQSLGKTQRLVRNIAQVRAAQAVNAPVTTTSRGGTLTGGNDIDEGTAIATSMIVQAHFSAELMEEFMQQPDAPVTILAQIGPHQKQTTATGKQIADMGDHIAFQFNSFSQAVGPIMDFFDDNRGSIQISDASGNSIYEEDELEYAEYEYTAGSQQLVIDFEIDDGEEEGEEGEEGDDGEEDDEEEEEEQHHQGNNNKQKTQ